METKEAAAAEQLQQQQQPEPGQEQWRGAVEAALPSTPASAAWPHIASFCALHRYLPGIDVCQLAAGDDGRPGCVRYVASLAPAAAGGAGREVASWAREELLEIDGGARRLAYAVIGSSMGFGRYVASMAVAADGDEAAAGRCRLVWAFECDPVQGWSLDGLLGYLDGGVKAIAARIEEAAAAAAGAPAGGGDVVAAA
ncbi:lachrymatory-factor synthase-like [Panicum miliaceum]|uniref:Lachrymatory-factor synthase-like n=1 Tax=Panicum miliaceum TaxID=4540 RepID=A0A3L6SX72_PANMI|nr:lachrymatory-factor synthase-like [Panicum miliaceum]